MCLCEFISGLIYEGVCGVHYSHESLCSSCMYVCMYVFMYHVCMYVCMCVCMYVLIHVCMYVCISFYVFSPDIVVHVSWKKTAPKPFDLTTTECAQVLNITHIHIYVCLNNNAFNVIETHILWYMCISEYQGT
jgi:hypothetical protein